jgi:hypothetical protein
VCVPPQHTSSTCQGADLSHVTPLPLAAREDEASCVKHDDGPPRDPPPGDGGPPTANLF